MSERNQPSGSQAPSNRSQASEEARKQRKAGEEYEEGMEKEWGANLEKLVAEDQEQSAQDLQEKVVARMQSWAADLRRIQAKVQQKRADPEATTNEEDVELGDGWTQRKEQVETKLDELRQRSDEATQDVRDKLANAIGDLRSFVERKRKEAGEELPEEEQPQEPQTPEQRS